MESLSLTDRQTALHILDRIEEAINTVQIRNSVIRNADDFLLTAEGREKLDAACMVNDFDSLKDAVRFFKEVLADK